MCYRVPGFLLISIEEEISPIKIAEIGKKTLDNVAL